MAKNTLSIISKVLAGSHKSSRPKVAKDTSIKVDNIFKKRNDLDNRTYAEKTACDIFSKFYSNTSDPMSIKEESLPLTTYANCIRTLRLKLEEDTNPAQLVSILWRRMSVANTIKTYRSECVNCNHYKYSPNYEHEKTLIFAGLMVTIYLSYPDKDKIGDIVSAIRTIAHSKENKEYFKPFDLAINIFDPSDITLNLVDAIKAIKATTKPYKALSLYEFLCTQFSNDESAIDYIRQECSSVPMSEPEMGSHIENVTVADGGAINMFDKSTVHAEVKALPSTDPQKLISNEHQ